MLVINYEPSLSWSHSVAGDSARPRLRQTVRLLIREIYGTVSTLRGLIFEPSLIFAGDWVFFCNLVKPKLVKLSSWSHESYLKTLNLQNHNSNCQVGLKTWCSLNNPLDYSSIWSQVQSWDKALVPLSSFCFYQTFFVLMRWISRLLRETNWPKTVDWLSKKKQWKI